MADDKKHIHYGGLEAALGANALAPGGAQAALPSAGGNIMPAGVVESNVDEAAANMGNQRRGHEDAIRSIEQKQNQRTMAVPTGDVAVKQKLREFGEPVSVFGEGAYERRERLRQIMAGRTAPTQENKRVETAEDGDLFYTEGTEELLEARVKIAEYSIPRGNQRLIKEREQRLEDPVEQEEKAERFCTYLQKTIAAEVSQVGDERPLTQGKFSPDGMLYGTSSWSGFIKLWKVPSCDPVLTIRAHEDRCNGIAFHPSCKGVPPFDGGDTCRLASACADSKVCLWSLTESNPMTVLEGHEDRVNRVLFHPLGEHLVSTSHDMSWRLWDVERSCEILLQEGHSKPTYGVAIHPDGSLIATTDLGGIVRVWDLRSGKCIMPLTGHGRQALTCDFHPRGTMLATAADDHMVRIWDMRRRRCVNSVLAHSKLISEVKFDQGEGRVLLSSSYDCTVKLWNTVDYRCCKTLIGHEARVMGADHISTQVHGHHYVGSVAFDRTLKFWSSAAKADQIPDSSSFK